MILCALGIPCPSHEPSYRVGERAQVTHPKNAEYCARWQKKNPKWKAEWRKRQKALWQAEKKRHNDRSREHAKNTHRRWTEEEHRAVLESTLPDRELSFLLGRSRAAIMDRRHLLLRRARQAEDAVAGTVEGCTDTQARKGVMQSETPHSQEGR